MVPEGRLVNTRRKGVTMITTQGCRAGVSELNSVGSGFVYLNLADCS